MANEAKHSPLPWRAVGRRIYNANDHALAVVDGQALVDNEHADLAAFIVRACNAFGGLVEAVEALFECFTPEHLDFVSRTNVGYRLRLALDAAKEKKG